MSALPVLAALLVAGASPRAPVLRVSVEKDAASRCRANAALVKAVRARLPSVRVAAGGAQGPEDLSASMSPEGEAWRFEVRRASGELAMTRTLRRLQCAQLGDTGALILERYLEEISWSGRAIGIEPLPRAGPPPAGDGAVAGPRSAAHDGESPSDSPASGPDGGSPAPQLTGTGGPAADSHAAAADGGSSGSLLAPGAAQAADDSKAVPPDGGPAVSLRSGGPVDASSAPAAVPPAAEPLLTHLTLSAGGAGWLQLPLEAGPVLSLELGAHLGRYRVGALLLAGWPSEHPVVIDARLRGATRVQAFLAGATAARCFGEGLSFCGGLLGAARLTAGSATGSGLYRQRTALVPLGELGLYGRLSYPLTRHLEASLDLAAAAPLGSASFGIEGADSDPAGTPAVDLISTLRVGWRLF
ncbi:MAG: hypothetical protein ACYC8T_37545 [Myxococcaceae bacterium]